MGLGVFLLQYFPLCQDMKTIAFYFHKHEYSWVVKIRSTSEVTTLPIILTAALLALVSIIA